MIAKFASTRHSVDRPLRTQGRAEFAPSVEPSYRTQPTIAEASRHVGEAKAIGVHVTGDSGFTLIELMVVLLILAILLAIAIPTFLGVTKSANDRAAQSNLNTALLNAKAQFQQNSQQYPTSATLVAALHSAEPSLSFTTAASSSQNQISVFATADGSGLVMADYSAQTKNCWVVVDLPVSTTAVASTPFTSTSQTPAVGVFPATVSPSAAAAVTFATNQLGPTYAEIKTTSTGTETSASCVASAPQAIANTTYAYSFTSFPAI